MIRPQRRLLGIWQDLPTVAIDVVGDLMLDRYVHGEANRVSPEAPIPILDEVRVDERPGGAANLAANLAGLGVRVRVFGRVGDDAEGRRLAELLHERGVDVAGLMPDPMIPTILKTRFVAANRQVLRLDREARSPFAGAAVESAFAAWIARAEGMILVSDYGKGVVTAGRLDRVREAGRPFLVDPAPGRDPNHYRGAGLITPNRAECLAVAEAGAEGDPEALAAAYAARAGGDVLLKLGGEGAVLCRREGETRRFAALERPVYDVTGAGDTTLAVLARALAGGAALTDAVALGMVGGGVAVSRFGTWALDGREFMETLLSLP